MICYSNNISFFSNSYKSLSIVSNSTTRKHASNHAINSPKRGEIYLIDFGVNVGSELNNIHMGIIVQSSYKNNVSNTVVVVPISSSPKLYDTHEQITSSDIKSGHLNKLPSKAKSEQITCIDKSRIIHKIGSVTPDFMSRLDIKILKNLGIQHFAA